MNGALTLRPRGVWLVTSLELKQRIRSVRWYVALAVWTLVLLGLGLVVLAPTAVWSSEWSTVEQTSAVMFSLLAILVLFAMMLVLPALSAGSINGDRTAGTLATLQATLLSPLEIVLGKLLAGWFTGLVFLALSLPSLLPTALIGGVGVLYLLRVLLLIAVLALCIVALGLGLSAITQRQLGSVVLTYVLVLGATVALPVVWGSSGAVLRQEKEVTTYSTTYMDPGPGGSGGVLCEEHVETHTVMRLDWSQPLIWPNPVVMLADVSPRMSDVFAENQDDPYHPDALRVISLGVRSAVTPLAPGHYVWCSPESAGYPEDIDRDPTTLPVWPFGLVIWLGVGAGSVALATQRLAVPIKRLGKGTRIA